MSVQHLAPMIQQILSAPDTDLSTVSAKRVRKQLVELDPEITLDFIKENKLAIDTLIGSIFESVNNTDTGVRVEPANGSANGKRKREDDDEGRGTARVKDEDDDTQGEDERASAEDEDEAESPSPATPVPKKARKGTAQGLTDEEYARQLSSEINQRPSRGSRKGNGTSKKGASRTPKKKKSRAQIEDSDDDEEAEGSSRKKKPTKAKKKTSGGGGDAKGGFAKEFALSEPLAALIDTPQLSRPQVVKKLWEYIKGHDLQNPKNRREILCDDALRAVFNSDKIDMFTMNKFLGQHLYELES